MPQLRLALLLPALVAGCAAGQPQSVVPQAACRATLRGEILTTVTEFPSGFRLEGQWTLLGLGPTGGADSRGRMLADLVLDELSQATSVTAQPISLPFYTPLRLRAIAPSAAEALQEVANTWCNTVLDANRRGLRFDRLVPAIRGQIT